MNILIFELKAQLRTFIIWTAVLLFTYIVFFKGIYPVFYDSLEDVLKMINSFPPEFAAAFGIHVADMFSYTGFFSFGYINLIFISAAVVLYIADNADGVLPGRFILAAASVFFTQLVFLSVGLFYAVFSKKVRTVAGAATAFGFGAFILSALVNILDEEVLFFIAPLKYFEPASVFSAGMYEMKYVIAAVAVIAVLTVSAYIKFWKSDAHAV